MASRASLSAVRRRSVSRLSQKLLALGQRQLDLHPAALEVQPRRNQRLPLLLRLSHQFLDLIACMSSFRVRSGA